MGEMLQLVEGYVSQSFFTECEGKENQFKMKFTDYQAFFE